MNLMRGSGLFPRKRTTGQLSQNMYWAYYLGFNTGNGEKQSCSQAEPGQLCKWLFFLLKRFPSPRKEIKLREGTKADLLKQGRQSYTNQRPIQSPVRPTCPSVGLRNWLFGSRWIGVGRTDGDWEHRWAWGVTVSVSLVYKN